MTKKDSLPICETSLLTVGRPRKWKGPEELASLINNYFATTPIEEYSTTGLALQIGASKQLLSDYEKIEGFTEKIQNARLIVEHSYELSLRKYGRTGDIFALKNFGWVDKREIETADVTKTKYEAWLKENQESLKDVTPSNKMIQE